MFIQKIRAFNIDEIDGYSVVKQEKVQIMWKISEASPIN